MSVEETPTWDMYPNCYQFSQFPQPSPFEFSHDAGPSAYQDIAQNVMENTLPPLQFKSTYPQPQLETLPNISSLEEPIPSIQSLSANADLKHRNEELSAEIEVYEHDLRTAEARVAELVKKLEHEQQRHKAKIAGLRSLVQRERTERRARDMAIYETVKRERQNLDAVVGLDYEDLEEALEDHIEVLEDLEETLEGRLRIGGAKEMAIVIEED